MTQLRTDSPGRRKSFFGASAVRGAEGVRALVRLRIPTFYKTKIYKVSRSATCCGAIIGRLHPRQGLFGCAADTAVSVVRTSCRRPLPPVWKQQSEPEVPFGELPALPVISVCLPCRYRPSGSACHIGLPAVSALTSRLCLSCRFACRIGTDPARCYRMPWRPMGMPSPSVRCAALFRTGTHCGVCFIVSRSVATKKLIHPGERFIARPTTPPRLSMTV